MRKAPRVSKLACRSAAVVGILAAGGAALYLGNPDSILVASYGRSLGKTELSWSAQHRGNIWLSSAPAGAGKIGSALHSGLAIGDRITIAKRGGGAQEIEVTGLEQVDGAGSGVGGRHYQIVAGRAVADGASVRFIFSVEDVPTTAPATSIGQGRSL